MQSRTLPPWWAAILVCGLYVLAVRSVITAANGESGNVYSVGAPSPSFAKWQGSDIVATQILSIARSAFAVLHCAVFIYLFFEVSHQYWGYARDLGSCLEDEVAILRGPVRLYSYFTIWTYTAQGLYFAAAAYCSYQSSVGQDPGSALAWVTEGLFEITCSCGLLVTVVVTFIFKTKQQTFPDLLMHNVNALEIATELLLGRTPISLYHAAFPLLWGLTFIIASWLNAPHLARLARHHTSHGNGGNFVYFFLDWTLPWKSFAACKFSLLTVLLISYFAVFGLQAMFQYSADLHASFLLQASIAYGFVFLITTWRIPKEIHQRLQLTSS